MLSNPALKLIAAAGLAFAATGAAQAQPPMHDHGVTHQRTVVETRHTEVTHHDMGYHHRRCHMEYHHHHRVRVCR